MEFTKQGPKRRRRTRRDVNRCGHKGGMTRRWLKLDWYKDGAHMSREQIARKAPLPFEERCQPTRKDQQ